VVPARGLKKGLCPWEGRSATDRFARGDNQRLPLFVGSQSVNVCAETRVAATATERNLESILASDVEARRRDNAKVNSPEGRNWRVSKKIMNKHNDRVDAVYRTGETQKGS
jgi:hypothetical protein